MSAASTALQHRIRPGVPWSRDLVVVAAAVVCAWVTWWLAVTAGGVDLVVSAGPGVQRVEGAAVAISAGVGALAGMLTLRALEARTSRALRIWTVLAVLALLVSLLGPSSALTPVSKGTLVGLHAVVAVVVVAAHRSRIASRSRAEVMPPASPTVTNRGRTP